MKLRIIFLAGILAATVSHAQAPKAKPAKPAAPSTPAASASSPVGNPGIITSDLAGRDLYVIAQALDVGRAMNFLARQAARTEKPELRGFGDDLVKTLAAQGAVLETFAEMRNVRVPGENSPTQKNVADRLAGLAGVKLEKVFLDTFIELDRRLIGAYELGSKSTDATLAKFAEQALADAKDHLAFVQSMMGIAAPKPPPVAEAPPALEPPAPAADAPRPAFRTRVPLQ